MDVEIEGGIKLKIIKKTKIFEDQLDSDAWRERNERGGGDQTYFKNK